jgi:hypothetical protein
VGIVQGHVVTEYHIPYFEFGKRRLCRDLYEGFDMNTAQLTFHLNALFVEDASVILVAVILDRTSLGV